MNEMTFIDKSWYVIIKNPHKYIKFPSKGGKYDLGKLTFQKQTNAEIFSIVMLVRMLNLRMYFH